MKIRQLLKQITSGSFDDAKKLAVSLEKLLRCEHCKGEGGSTECRRTQCALNQWHDYDVCSIPEHQTYQKCKNCSGKIYQASPDLLKLIAKYTILKSRKN